MNYTYYQIGWKNLCLNNFAMFKLQYRWFWVKEHETKNIYIYYTYTTHSNQNNHRQPDKFSKFQAYFLSILKI